MHVIVFSKPNCSECTNTYGALARIGLHREHGTYTIIDLTEDAKAMEYVSNVLGYRGAPVVVVSEAPIEQLMDPEDPAVPLMHWNRFRYDNIRQLSELLVAA